MFTNCSLGIHSPLKNWGYNTDEIKKGGMTMKKILAIVLAATLLLSCSLALAEPAPTGGAEGEMAQGNPPEMPEGDMPGDPPSGDPGAPGDGEGNPPEKPDGEAPNGDMPGGPGGMGGGMQGAPTEYEAVYTVTEDETFTGALESTGTDENLIHVEAGTAVITGAALTRNSADSTGGDSASFYGVGAAVLATGGTVVIEDSTISTDAAGGAGVFAYGDGVAYVSDTTITTEQDTSGGIHVAGGGTLYAKDLDVTTNGESAAAIRSDRGSGTMVVDGGSYVSNGLGSPAVYVTADITIHGADLEATGSEALCMEGLNTVRLYDCNLSGDMEDLDQNDNTWTVIVYQSMSGDSEVGEGRFEMSGGTLTSANGGLFYTTNTESEFVLENVAISAAEDSEYFLRVTGNANQRGWGSTGSNGADCTFTGIAQEMNGDVLWDTISTLDMYVTESSRLTGAVIDDESCAGEGGDGYCSLYIDADSSWIVTGDSVLTNLYCEGSIADADGNSVSIVSEDGTVLVEGTSDYSIVVSNYADSCDLTHKGSVSTWEDYAVDFESRS